MANLRERKKYTAKSILLKKKEIIYNVLQLCSEEKKKVFLTLCLWRSIASIGENSCKNERTGKNICMDFSYAE
jgi:hypothetical protein